jgi:jagged-like protein
MICFSGNGYLIALICIILIILIAVGVGGVYYWHQMLRRRHGAGTLTGSTTLGGPCHRHHDDEKSNNLQNEENLRRYANPLKDEAGSTMVGSASSKVGPGSVSGVEGSGTSDLPRVSVVRPLSSAAGPGEPPGTGSGAEMLELMDDSVTPGLGKSIPSQSSDPHPGLRSGHRSSQILLFKAQNPDVRKNTATTFDDAGAHKDFAKRIINLKVLPPLQRTLQPSQGERNGGGGGDVLTVIV